MNTVFVDSIEELPSKCDAIVLLVFDSRPISQSVTRYGKPASERLTQLQQQGDLDCKRMKINLVHGLPGVDAPRVLVVGGGSEDTFGPQDAYRCAAAAMKTLANVHRERVVIDFGNLQGDLARAAITGALNGCHGQDLMRASKSINPPDSILWLGLEKQDIRWGSVVGEAMLLARELVNLPANVIYPESFTQRAIEVAVAEGLELEIWDELRLRKEGCGALLAVARGSSRPPRLLIMRHRGDSQLPRLALVGKGVTFDSGGLSLKPSDSMLTMKGDMAGAATVLATMKAVAALQLPRPVVGLVGLVENMISGSSFKLGDVLTARNGKTIEVHNTDAEGRLVLADVLNVALQEKPAAMVDLATLTGACMVALGTDIAGLMSNHQGLLEQVRQAASDAGEEVWPLPMSAHFSDQIQGKVADLKNLGEGRWAGAITAAKFLEEFVADTPWVHVDIAGPAFYESARTYQDAGATGCMLRSLIHLAESELFR
jgi:leucyl aminopeptidase